MPPPSKWLHTRPSIGRRIDSTNFRPIKLPLPGYTPSDPADRWNFCTLRQALSPPTSAAALGEHPSEDFAERADQAGRNEKQAGDERTKYLLHNIIDLTYTHKYYTFQVRYS